MNQKGHFPSEAYSDDGFISWETSILGSKDTYLAVFNVSDPFSTTVDRRLGKQVRVDRGNPIAQIDERLSGAKRLLLETTDARDGIMFDHSVWVNPRFVMADGTEIDITALPIVHSSVGYGTASTTLDPEGTPLQIAAKPGAKLLSVHAPSKVVIDVPKGAVRFIAEGFLSDKAMAQKTGGTVEFSAYRLPTVPPSQKGLPEPAMIAALSKHYGKLLPIWPQEGNIIPWHGCQLYKYKAK
jgi:hypothetical protein